MTGQTAILNRLVRRMRERGADPLRPLLDAYLLERDEAEERYWAPERPLEEAYRPPGRLSPSDLCGCERAAAMKFVGVQGRRRRDPDNVLILEDGTWRHYKWHAIFQDMALVLGPERFRCISEERRVEYEDLYVSGSLDNLLWLKPTPSSKGKKWVVEIKGISDAGFQYILRQDEPIAKHVKQLIAYCRSLSVPRGLLWYENKNSQDTKAFIVRYDDEVWHEVTGWATSVISFLDRERVPPMHPDCNRGTITFERCQFAEYCYGDYDKADLRRIMFDGFEGTEETWQANRSSE